MIDPTDPVLDGPVILPEPSSNKNVLSEAEIKACWRANMLEAASCAVLLSELPAMGATYKRLRDHLKLAEGACRQMGHWREDSRWFYMVPYLATLHEMTRQMVANHYARKLFLVLEQKLRAFVREADDLENKKTGRVGMILPEELPAPHRETRPVQVII